MTTADRNSTDKRNPAADSLRAIYRSARDGGTIDARALVAAIGEAVAGGVDVRDCLRCFEPYAYIRINCVRGADAVALARLARERGGWKAAIVVASLLGWGDTWAAAMTAHFGPTGTHESYLDADGRPTAETIARFPRIGEAMREAAERWENHMGYYERCGGVTRWDDVVQMRTR